MAGGPFTSVQHKDVIEPQWNQFGVSTRKLEGDSSQSIDVKLT
jgi:hypothetical protein